MNKVYAEFFGPDKPARATMAVAGLAFDVLVEIEAIARDPEAPGGISRF